MDSSRRFPARAQPAFDARGEEYRRVTLGHLDTFHNAFRQWSAEEMWHPATDSPLLYERNHASSYLGRAGQPWDERPFVILHTVSVLHLSFAEQLLDSMTALLHARQVMFGLAPIARTTIEHSSLVCWLLDPRAPDPHIAAGGSPPDSTGMRRRGSRTMLHELKDLTRSKTTQHQLGLNTASRAGSDVVRLKRDEIPLYFEDNEVENRNGTYFIRGESYPSFTEMLSVLDAITGGDGNPEGVYAVLSNGAHPVFSHMLNLLSFNDQGMPTGWGLSDLKYIHRLIINSAQAVATAWQLVATYLGHDQRLPRELILEFSNDKYFEQFSD